MRYSLLSQFQGVLVGAAIGELLGASCAAQASQSQLGAVSKRSVLNPEQWMQHLFSSATSEALPRTSETRWGSLAILGARSLAQRGELNLGDWQRHLQLLQLQTEEIVDLRSLEAGGMAIASLPIALFFHEDQTKLYQQLQQVSQGAALQAPAILASFIISLAIAQALQNQFHPHQIIPQIIAAITRLETRLDCPIAEPDSMTILMQQLAQVQTLLEQHASLELARSQFYQTFQATPPSSALKQMQPILVALYCCLATPNDWRLAVLRSAQMKMAPQLVSTLTGALAGAFNSLSGIPVEWRLTLDQLHSGTSTLKSLWQVVELESEVMELATHLLATWSGTYDTQKFSVKRYQVPAIAAPRVIRPR